MYISGPFTTYSLIIKRRFIPFEMTEPYAPLYQLGLNLGIAIPRSEDIPRFILGLSFSVLSTFSNLGTTSLGLFQLSL